MVVLPSGNVTSVAPVSNSSQSSLPATASQDATSERLSSTLRSTTCALRMMIESLPSVISVLSPVAVTLGAAAVPENAALGAGAGAAAWRAVSAKLTVPVLESEQAASANDSASAISVTFFILPPQQGLDGYAYDLRAIRVASDVPRAGRPGARPPRARRVRDLTCVHDTWQVSLYQIGANAARHEPGGI